MNETSKLKYDPMVMHEFMWMEKLLEKDYTHCMGRVFDLDAINMKKNIREVYIGIDDCTASLNNMVNVINKLMALRVEK
jgi:hypothetical protein